MKRSTKTLALTAGLLYDLRCCRMSQRERRRVTSANAAPVSTAGVWMFPYSSRKLEAPTSDAIASFEDLTLGKEAGKNQLQPVIPPRGK